MASTELHVVYGPSEEEVRTAAKEKLDREEEAAAKRGEEERAAKAAQEKYEKEAPARRKLAEAEAREAAEHAPAAFLHVKTSSTLGGLDGTNLYTKIKVSTSKYAHVTIVVNHHKGTFHYRAPGEEGVEVPWGCNHPGITYHYVVTAVGGSGASLRRTGRFKMASVAWCAAQRRTEKQEADKRAHEEELLRLGHKVVHAEEEYCEKVLRGLPDTPFIAAGHIYLKCEADWRTPKDSYEVTVNESDTRG